MTERVQCPECGGTTDCSGNDACKHFQDASSNSAAKPHQLDHDAILAYCQTHKNWPQLTERERYVLVADAAKESMQWWFHDQTEAAYDKGVEDGRAIPNSAADVLADLRAKVEALPFDGRQIGSTPISKQAVLDLIDGTAT